MNWDAIGAIGEILGALGVVITLAYLSIQIRQNTKLLGDNAKRATQASIHQQNVVSYQDEGIAELLARGGSDRSSLEPSERVRFHGFWMTSFIAYQEAFYQVKLPNVDDNWWKIIEHHMLLYLRTPGLNDWWQRNKHVFGEEFIAFVDGSLE